VARAAIGLGANLGDAAASVSHALEKLAALGTVVARSSLYRARPWGELDQPDFVNAVALVETTLAPRALLTALKALEGELGRVPTYRWGPRAIDLDLLTYGDLALDEPGLTVPHPRLLERAFVLGPLAEIDPAFRPAFERLSLEERQGVHRLGDG
jgi:2-amino-4-hydroxy-6-hydroxymethyldihydropteridine diphosphokinase